MHFTEEHVAEHLNGISDSAALIRKLIAGGDMSDESGDCMDRNIKHIHIMCSMPHVRDSGADLSTFMDAADAGVAWLTSR